MAFHLLTIAENRCGKPRLTFCPFHQMAWLKVIFLYTFLNRFTLPDSKGGQCDVLAYSPKHSLRSTWKTIASPRFSIFERDRGCDDLNSLNLEQEEPRGRILTGKHPIVNIMVQDTLLPEGYYEMEDEENVRLLNTQSEAARPKLLVCRWCYFNLKRYLFQLVNYRICIMDSLFIHFNKLLPFYPLWKALSAS